MAERRFELVGGSKCLDFVNTMGGIRVTNPSEHLHGWADLVSWLRQAGLVSRSAAAGLLREAVDHPRRAAEAFSEALRLRESLHDVFAAAAAQRTAPVPALATVDAWVRQSLQERSLVPQGGGYAFEWRASDQLLAPLRPLAEDAAGLLTSQRLGLVRLCAEAELGRCGWLFLDETRNHSRRWCTMGDCGNRAKARRHYQKVKDARE
jgi:predicted RNA-binding Zn ribbon-like protein